MFIVSDDLTSTALSCYGSTVSKTPHIDSLASEGTRFSRAYCQATYCGPSRASFMSGYYPHATKVLNYVSGRKAIGDREMWAEYFKNRGYHTARVSKIFHMPVPIGIEKGTDGSDDPSCWTEKYNSQGPEWRAKGEGETLQRNPDGKKPVVGGNTFVYVKGEDDLEHSDYKTAVKASELLAKYKDLDKPFFLGVGFVRPHVPFVAPKKYYEPFPFEKMVLPKKVDGDWNDIPKPAINYCTSKNMQMDVLKQKKSVAAYYASVAYMDDMTGQVLKALKDNGLEDNTIVIFTSDHGYHLGEHDFWAKVSLLDESVKVPLIIKVPGKKPAVCDSLVELLDLFPTTASLCDLEVPERIQGKDLTPIFRDPFHSVKDCIVSANGKGTLIQTKDWAYMEYKKNGGAMLYNMQKDLKQYTNLAKNPEYKTVLEMMKKRLVERLDEIRKNDLGFKY
ncbi:MAG: sulfatase [Lentisphaeraceae bacterium]|nr:sulfatase [Lentisphaeraceae bacterium]